jgi:DNA-binding CsgD family transcriptional regulator
MKKIGKQAGLLFRQYWRLLFMDNSRFSSLVYKIIGQPQRWQQDYIEIMHQILDDADDIDSQQKISEHSSKDHISNPKSNICDALIAFGSLLVNSRFKMILLDQAFSVIYQNKNDENLSAYVRPSPNSNKLKIDVQNKVMQAAKHNQTLENQSRLGGLSVVDHVGQNQEKLYLLTMHSCHAAGDSISTCYLLLVVSQQNNGKELNPDLIGRYQLTDKEQSVLINLINGRDISQIAKKSFVSENTVKTHLKSLYRKTNTKSQIDIVRLVLSDDSQILHTYFASKDSSSTFASKDSSSTFASKDRTLNEIYSKSSRLEADKP